VTPEARQSPRASAAQPNALLDDRTVELRVHNYKLSALSVKRASGTSAFEFASLSLSSENG
jgi:hypothetical protein